MKKKTDDLFYVNVDREPFLDEKPRRQDRAKCYCCKGTIVMRTAWWYEGSEGYKKSPPKYYYDGIGYFCSRNCAIRFATETARKALNHPEFNEIK